MKRIVLFAPVAMIVLVLLSSGTVDKATMERGQKVYKQYCSTCHQPDGGGVPGLNPPLEKTSYVLGSKTRLIQIVLKGMKTDEEIDGED
jgi:mono/diheme cytochrome c family protein